MKEDSQTECFWYGGDCCYCIMHAISNLLVPFLLMYIEPMIMITCFSLLTPEGELVGIVGGCKVVGAPVGDVIGACRHERY